MQAQQTHRAGELQHPIKKVLVVKEFSFPGTCQDKKLSMSSAILSQEVLYPQRSRLSHLRYTSRATGDSMPNLQQGE